MMKMSENLMATPKELTATQEKLLKERTAKVNSSDEARWTITDMCLEKMDQILVIVDAMRKDREERQAQLEAWEKKNNVKLAPEAHKNPRHTSPGRTRRAR
jgi:hypothetical protein